MSRKTSSSGHKIGLRLGAAPESAGKDEPRDRLRAFRELLPPANAAAAPRTSRAHRSGPESEPARKYDSSR